MKLKNFLAAILLIILVLNAFLPTFSQTNTEVFDKVELLVPNGKMINEKSVRLRLMENELQIETIADGKIVKTFKSKEIKNAEYSHSKNPRWKTGLELGAASTIFPALLLVTIPPGFSKHRRHWLVLNAKGNYAVLKLIKKNRNSFCPHWKLKQALPSRAWEIVNNL